MLRWHKPNRFPWRRISLSDCLHRVFGFSPVVQINCSHTWKLIVHSDRKWYHFVNPIMLLILYYTVATLIRLWLQEPLDQLTVRTEMKICQRVYPKQGGQHSCNPRDQNCSSYWDEISRFAHFKWFKKWDVSQGLGLLRLGEGSFTSVYCSSPFVCIYIQL